MAGKRFRYQKGGKFLSFKVEKLQVTKCSFLRRSLANFNSYCLQVPLSLKVAKV
jgi:hypothetical protein